MAKYWYSKHKVEWIGVAGETITKEHPASDMRQIRNPNWTLEERLRPDSNGLYTGYADRYVVNGVGHVFLYPLTSRANQTTTKVIRYTRADKITEYEYRMTGTIYTATPNKGDLIDVFVAEENEFPTNGIQGDFWYVRGDKAFPSLKLNGQTIGGAKIKDSTGQIREVGNVYFKDSSGTVRNLK